MEGTEARSQQCSILTTEYIETASSSSSGALPEARKEPAFADANFVLKNAVQNAGNQHSLLGRYLLVRWQFLGLRGLCIGLVVPQRPGNGQPVQDLQFYDGVAHRARWLPALPAPTT
jgi:hypothetical protein